MVQWRGLGFLVIVFGGAAGLAWFFGVDYLAQQIYGATPVSDDLFSFYEPTKYWLLLSAAAGVAAAVTLGVGLVLNRGGNYHALFFIPVQFWSAVFVLVAGVAPFIGPELTSDIAQIESSYADECGELEGATAPMCQCLADAVKSSKDEVLYLSYLFFVRDYPGSDDPDDSLLDSFYEELVPALSPELKSGFDAVEPRFWACFE